MNPTEEVQSTAPHPSALATWRKRRQWVIDPKLQYTLIASAGILVFCSVLIFYGVATRASIQFNSYFLKMDRETRELLSEQFQQTLQNFKYCLIIGYVGFSALFAIITLRLSNRIAGPIYNLKRKMRLLRENGELKPVKFRDADLLQDLAVEYNLLVEYLQKKEAEKQG